MAVLAASSVLNALYFIRTMIRIYTRPENDENGIRDSAIVKSSPRPGYHIPMLILTAVNLMLGLFSQVFVNLIRQGIAMFG